MIIPMSKGRAPTGPQEEPDKTFLLMAAGKAHKDFNAAFSAAKELQRRQDQSIGKMSTPQEEKEFYSDEPTPKARAKEERAGKATTESIEKNLEGMTTMPQGLEVTRYKGGKI